MHLARLKYDHKPLKLVIMLELQFSRGRPFHFLAGWVEHPTFLDFVKQNWNVSTSMFKLHSKFTDQVKSWNKEVCGHISTLKKILTRDWVMDDEQLKIEVVNFYSNLYGEHPRPTKDFPSSAFPRLNDGDLNFLRRPVTDEEIKNALFTMAPLKAPGSDGGVQQGCLLSLYLFNLYMKWLGHSIHNAIGAGTWSPVRLARDGPPLSHLFFADDLLLFGHVNDNQAQIIKNILEAFCAFLGHRHYLGVPLLHDKVTNSTLSFVVDRVRSKLSSWDARQLSFAGRITLAQLTMMVPIEICDEIERMVRRFVWGSHNGSSKMALVWPLLRENLVLSVGDGKSIKCWQDSWIPNCDPLLNFIPSSANLNLDCSLSDLIAAAGGCVKDYKGEWIIGFARYLGNCSVLEVELWGILDGLNFMVDRCFKKVLIQTDSIEVINAIMEDTRGISNSTIIRRIHQTLKKVEQWKIQHVLRDDNLIIDRLAKSVRNRSLGLRLIEIPPLRI
ncbi:hypothetical protein J1N35_044731 [Gossypium stocksii]|uniref:RNase H type-1 domain-containing protein n=1 Tax=Gossypium stocksii TaxID=47602 RepID=A0A9D3ZGJ3_9ROSI|nr:hypothetical protein J1N35_044731 [Gossypium stocksii]